MLALARTSPTLRGMIVPQFWAEARIQHQQSPDRRITVRRFGWSDASQEAAQSHAEHRVQEACERMASGEKLLRREPRRGYNGAEGVPIREEIVSRHGEAVITRNSYGALCLNTPDVMFVDVDEGSDSPGCFRRIFPCLLLFSGGYWLCNALSNWMLVFLILLPAIWLTLWLSDKVTEIAVRRQGGLTAIARRKADEFIAARPDWRIRLYRTPAGFRLLVMHRTFDPGSEEVAAIFKAAGTDPVYGIMCRSQKCFRARLTPKPWRIGLTDLGRPHRRTWPVPPEALAARRAWETEYERLSAGYAACGFIGEYGSGPVDASARMVQERHDRLAGAESGLPLA
jgi:hypothetical protein